LMSDASTAMEQQLTSRYEEEFQRYIGWDDSTLRPGQATA